MYKPGGHAHRSAHAWRQLFKFTNISRNNWDSTVSLKCVYDHLFWLSFCVFGHHQWANFPRTTSIVIPGTYMHLFQNPRTLEGALCHLNSLLVKFFNGFGQSHHIYRSDGQKWSTCVQWWQYLQHKSFPLSFWLNFSGDFNDVFWWQTHYKKGDVLMGRFLPTD